MKRITFYSKNKNEIKNITEEIRSIVEKSGVKEGLCNIYAPHATGAIIINENADPNVTLDILRFLSEAITEGRWLHDGVDGNGAAHIKSAIVGSSQTVPVIDGELALGTWQDIMFCEFDGPKKREVLVTLIKSV